MASVALAKLAVLSVRMSLFLFVLNTRNISVTPHHSNTSCTSMSARLRDRPSSPDMQTSGQLSALSQNFTLVSSDEKETVMPVYELMSSS